MHEYIKIDLSHIKRAENDLKVTDKARWMNFVTACVNFLNNVFRLFARNLLWYTKCSSRKTWKESHTKKKVGCKPKFKLSMYEIPLVCFPLYWHIGNPSIRTIDKTAKTKYNFTVLK